MYMSTLHALRVPGPADLDAVSRGNDVVVARGPDDGAGFQLAHCPGEHAARFEARERAGDVGMRLLRLGHRGVPELPEAAVARRGHQAVVMLAAQRLEPDPVAFQRDGLRRDHAAPLRRITPLLLTRRPFCTCRRSPAPP